MSCDASHTYDRDGTCVTCGYATPTDRPIIPSLPAELVKLSEQTQTTYNVALDTGHDDVARELRVLADLVAALIAKTLRGTLERAS